VTDALRPSRAAQDAPRRAALVLPERTISFREVEALVAARRAEVLCRPFVPCVAEPTLETFALLWACLEHGVPFVPLHPRLPEAARAELVEALEQTPPPAGTAAVVWSSGTTGAPRGVCLSAENVVAGAAASAANLGWREDDRWLCALPLAHVGGLTIPIRCLLARRAVVALPRFEETAVLAAIRDPRRRPTLASFVPTMLARLVAADDGGALGRLRAILLGGDAAPPALLEECRARGLAVLATYGLTEAGGQVATARPDAVARGAPDAGAGPPLPGIEVRIDAAGHILVRGPTVAHAILGEPPRAPEAWLDTGDLGHVDTAGRLHPTGRARDLIVTGGENVSPVRVEEVLGRCPGVRAALVFGVPDPAWGQVVCAALVAGPDRPTDEALRAHGSRWLAAHELPRRIAWVEALPVSPSGKVDRAAAPVLAIARARRGGRSPEDRTRRPSV